jgi:hypothetical protein
LTRIFNKNGILNLKLGLFLDTGKISDSSPGLGSRHWLWDTGLQAKVRALGVGIIVSYGKDLRSGNNAFYATVGRQGSQALPKRKQAAQHNHED